MTDNYRYWVTFHTKYINPNPSLGPMFEFFPLNLNLDIVYKLNEKLPAIWETSIEGEFTFDSSMFDYIVGFLGDANYDDYLIEMRITSPAGIVTGGTKIVFNITEFADYDYNQKTVKAKSFEQTFAPNDLRNLLDKKILLSPGNLVISGMTNRAKSFRQFLNDIFTFLYPIHYWDQSQIYYEGGYGDLENIRLTSMRNVYADSVPNYLGGSEYETTLQEVLTWFEVMRGRHVYFDSYGDNQILFKLPQDLVTNVYPVENLVVNMRQEQYNQSKLYLKEVIEMSQNNQIGSDIDWLANELVYKRGKESIKYDLSKITTLPINSPDLNGNGVFMAYVNLANNTMLTSNSYMSGLPKTNVIFSPSNFLIAHFRHYTYSNRGSYSIGTYVGYNGKLGYCKDIIDMPILEVILPNPFVFYSGLRWRTDEYNIKNQITRVTEQRFKLNKGTTQFKSVAYYNDFND